MAKDRGLEAINRKLLRQSQILQTTIRALLEKRRPLHILEIGCGTGRALMELAWQFKGEEVKFYGINKKAGSPLSSDADLRRTALQDGIAPQDEIEKLALPQVFFYDATQLHFDDDSLDMIYFSSVIRFIPRKAEFLEEICRVLRPGGVALLRISSSGWNYPYSRALDDLMLTPYESRFVLKYGNELIPLEVYLKSFDEAGFSFEFIDLPACVMRIGKQRPGKIALRLNYDEALSVAMAQLPYGDESTGDGKGGTRSVYNLSAGDYQALLTRGLLSKEMLQSAEMVQAGMAAMKASSKRNDSARAPEGNMTRLAKKQAYVSSFQVGQRVKIKGKRNGERRFYAIKIKLDADDGAEDELEGAIEWVDPAAQRLGLLGLSVHADGIALADMASGMMVKARGKYLDGRFIAIKVKVQETSWSGGEEIQGEIQATDVVNGTIQVTGFTIITDAKTRLVGSRLGEKYHEGVS